MTLLGQNVNAYGVEFGDRQAFSKLLRACGEIEGLERVRFTSPHPAEFTDDVIEAMAETPNVMPSLHMPLQSGSDKVLKDMRRSYRQAKYLGIIDRVRAAMPDAAITTDIIVGFPGETEEDFLETHEGRRAGAVRRRVHLPVLQAPRHPGRRRSRTRCPRRSCRSATSGSSRSPTRSPGTRTSALVGRTVELMVAEGEGRKDAATHRLSGRARDNRLVHFTPVDRGRSPGRRRPGDMVEVEVTYAAPHHLVADGPVRSVRRTRAGDAWEARTAPKPPGVLARPADRRRPAPLPEQPAATSASASRACTIGGVLPIRIDSSTRSSWGTTGDGQRVQVEPPQVRALVRLHDPRRAGPRRGREEVVDPLVDRVVAGRRCAACAPRHAGRRR